MLRMTGAILTSFLLIGCAQRGPEPEAFGIRESLWKTLTNEQKDMVIQGYNKQKERADRHHKALSSAE